MLWWLLACTEEPEDRVEPTHGQTTAPGDDDDDTIIECEPALEVLQLEVIPGRLGNDREIRVTLSESAPVAMLCSAPGDPSEHLVESSASSAEHALRLQGLLPDSSYTCQVAPTEPVLCGPPAEVEVSTGPAPNFPELTVEVDAALGMTGYWTLLPYLRGACSWADHAWLVLYDAQGVARWWYQMPQWVWVDVEALYDPETNHIVWGGGAEEDGGLGRTRFVDLWEGDVYAAAFPDWQETRFNHDAKRLPDGRVLTLDYRTVSRYGQYWLGFGARLHDPDTDTIELEFDAQRYVDEGWLRIWEQGNADDLYHANWVEWVDHDDGPRLYVSLCSDWSILSLDGATGDVRYKLGRGLGWTVLDEAGQELSEDELPQCQHGNEVVGDDVLLIYDNGQDRDHSQILELAVDPETLTAQRLWQWSEPDWHEGTLGDVDALEGGRVLVTEAHPECWTDSPGDRSAIVEVDRATGQVASRLTFPEIEDTTYRSERYDGCALMSSTLACPALASRRDELDALVGWNENP